MIDRRSRRLGASPVHVPAFGACAIAALLLAACRDRAAAARTGEVRAIVPIAGLRSAQAQAVVVAMTRILGGAEEVTLDTRPRIELPQLLASHNISPGPLRFDIRLKEGADADFSFRPAVLAVRDIASGIRLRPRAILLASRRAARQNTAQSSSPTVSGSIVARALADRGSVGSRYLSHQSGDGPDRRQDDPRL